MLIGADISIAILIIFLVAAMCTAKNRKYPDNIVPILALVLLLYELSIVTCQENQKDKDAGSRIITGIHWYIAGKL